MKHETFDVLAKMFAIANNAEGDSIPVEVVLDHLKRMTVLELLPSKIGKFDIWDAISSQGNLARIEHRDGFMYASTAYSIFKIRSAYDSNLEGKVVYKNGTIRRAVGTTFESTIRGYKTQIEEKKRSIKIDFDRLKEVDKEARALKKILGRDYKAIISFKGRIHFYYDDLLRLFKFMESSGIDTIEYYAGEEKSNVVMAESADGNVGIIMPLSGDFRQRRDVIKW
jgi:hypothetical protein